MTRSTPAPLRENHALAFVGEPVPAAARVSARTARALLETRNPNGKSNHDVLRRTIGADGVDRWMIAFPPEMDEREAALYARPYAELNRHRDAFRAGAAHAAAHRELRAALARLERYLATPVESDAPDFEWIDSDLTPDDSLLVVARDDDFTRGVLRSAPFRAWWRAVQTADDPTRAVATFPFPWPPATLLSALSSAQEEQRFAIAKADRAHAEGELDAAIARAYGWPTGLEDAEFLARLRALHATKA